MKVIICGCAKNIVNFWTNTSKNLQIIFDSLEDYKCIIIESNSTDNSLEVLNDWSKNNPKINIVSLGNLQEQSRTKRIALCRNKYLENIEGCLCISSQQSNSIPNCLDLKAQIS